MNKAPFPDYQNRPCLLKIFTHVTVRAFTCYLVAKRQNQLNVLYAVLCVKNIEQGQKKTTTMIFVVICTARHWSLAFCISTFV